MRHRCSPAPTPSRVARVRSALAAAIAALSVAAPFPVHAAPISGQGTWESTLKARDAAGYAVALDDPSATYFHDAALDITWLADIGANGRMAWSSAVAWASGLTAMGGGWRLPARVDGDMWRCGSRLAHGDDCGPGSAGRGAYGELAHLYFVTLGNVWDCQPGPADCAAGIGRGPTNTAYFRNVRPAGDRSNAAPVDFGGWALSLSEGDARAGRDGFPLYATAVRDGDVLQAGRVPEPGGLALALTGLVALGMGRRRSHAARRPDRSN